MIAIEAENLGKHYHLQGHGPPTLYGRINDFMHGRRPAPFWAIRGVNFQIKPGEVCGIIGPNGSGKSSTLGLTAGTITPSEGRVRTEGRISSLLELGAGFHADLTGRENVYLNAAMLGIPREDVTRRFDHIVGFAELEEFIDEPVKHYSSGMYVRLGFAVATEVNPDILLVDEVLAVGDLTFQKKCFARINEFKRKGKTILFVTHDLQTVEGFCDEAIFINAGRMADRGDPSTVVAGYRKSQQDPEEAEAPPKPEPTREDLVKVLTHQHGTLEVEIKNVVMRNGKGHETNTFTAGDPVVLDIEYYAQHAVDRPVFGFNVKDRGDGRLLYGSNTQIQNVRIDIPGPGAGRVRLRFDSMPFRTGSFTISLTIHSWDHMIHYHRQEDFYSFHMERESEAEGWVLLPAKWELD